MRGRTLLVALLICLGGGAAAWAGPFAEVPGSDRAYDDWAFLAERGVVAPPLDRVVTPSQPITRTDFALGLLALAQALADLDDSPQGAPGLRRLLAGLPPDQVRQVGARTASLLRQFQPELKLMRQDTKAALAAARRLQNGRSATIARPAAADGNSPRAGSARHAAVGTALRDPEAPGAGLRYRVRGAELGVTYSQMNPERAPLALFPPGALARAADAPATSRLAATPASTGYASRELTVRSLRGSLRYDLTRSLTLSLAYEALLRGSDGIRPLDDASLKTVGLGYRLSPSASVALRYHLIDYREPVASAGRQHDQAAETELVIRF